MECNLSPGGNRMSVTYTSFHFCFLKIGFPVTIACIYDSKTAYLLAKCLRELCCNIKIILADAGYHREITEKIKNTFGYILEVVVSGDKMNKFKTIGKR